MFLRTEEDPKIYKNTQKSIDMFPCTKEITRNFGCKSENYIFYKRSSDIQKGAQIGAKFYRIHIKYGRIFLRRKQPTSP
jgi:hypothetical protein